MSGSCAAFAGNIPCSLSRLSTNRSIFYKLEHLLLRQSRTALQPPSEGRSESLQTKRNVRHCQLQTDRIENVRNKFLYVIKCFFDVQLPT